MTNVGWYIDGVPGFGIPRARSWVEMLDFATSTFSTFLFGSVCTNVGNMMGARMKISGCCDWRVSVSVAFGVDSCGKPRECLVV